MTTPVPGRFDVEITSALVTLFVEVDAMLYVALVEVIMGAAAVEVTY